MRNFTNRERDKLPGLYVPPPVYARTDPYTQRMQWRMTLIEAQLENAQRSAKEWQKLAQQYWRWYTNAADSLEKSNQPHTRQLS